MKRRPLLLKSQGNILTESLKFDRKLLFIVLGLLFFGILMVFNASVVDATRQFGDGFFFARRQLISGIIGIVALIIMANINYKFWLKYAEYFVGGVIVLLILVLIPHLGGVSALGAKRWVSLGPIVIQPAELAKFALCIFASKILSQGKDIRIFFGTLVAILVLIMLEPDLGTATIVTVIGTIIYFASGAPLKHFLSLIPVGGIGLLLIMFSDYRRDRLMTFLNPTSDPLGTSYHIRQILIALGSGGVFGVGLGQSRQKYLFLPEPATDSIFAIIGEELGFVGASIVVLAFAFFVWRGLTIASRVQDPFGRLLAIGITCWIGIQAFVNLSAMVALVPLTGVPLPFVSYGGSALVVNLAAIGLLLNISRNQTKK